MAATRPVATPANSLGVGHYSPTELICSNFSSAGGAKKDGLTYRKLIVSDDRNSGNPRGNSVDDENATIAPPPDGCSARRDKRVRRRLTLIRRPPIAKLHVAAVPRRRAPHLPGGRPGRQYQQTAAANATNRESDGTSNRPSRRAG